MDEDFNPQDLKRKETIKNRIDFLKSTMPDVQPQDIVASHQSSCFQSELSEANVDLGDAAEGNRSQVSIPIVHVGAENEIV